MPYESTRCNLYFRTEKCGRVRFFLAEHRNSSAIVRNYV